MHHLVAKPLDVFGPGLGHDHDPFAAAWRVRPERHCVPRADPFHVRRRPFHVLRKHLAPAHDDHVLQAAAHNQFALGHVPEVPGTEPAVPEQRRSGFGTAVVARRDRVPAHFDLTDGPPGQFRARGRVGDAELQSGDGRAQEGKAPCVLAPERRGQGPAVALERRRLHHVLPSGT